MVETKFIPVDTKPWYELLFKEIYLGIYEEDRLLDKQQEIIVKTSPILNREANSEIDVTYKIRKWSDEEIVRILTLYNDGTPPKQIAKLLGEDYNAVKYVIYKPKYQKRYDELYRGKPLEGKLHSKSHKENSRKTYHRTKKSKWLVWKSNCFVSSLRRRTSEKLNITPKEMRTWMEKQERVCPYCKIELTESNIGLDHKQPVSREGSHLFDNLVLCCKSCNMIKGALSEDEYRAVLQLVDTWQDKGKYLFSRLRSAGTIYKK